MLSYLHKYLIEAGCDEAGRGCLAGAVYAAGRRRIGALWRRNRRVGIKQCCGWLHKYGLQSEAVESKLGKPVNKIQNIFKRVSPLNADASVAQGGSV